MGSWRGAALRRLRGRGQGRSVCLAAAEASLGEGTQMQVDASGRPLWGLCAPSPPWV